MKHLIFATLIILSFTQCKKSDSTNNTTVTPKASLKVDGTLLTLDSATALLYTLGVAPYNREIDVYGWKDGATVMEMHFLPKADTYMCDTSFSKAWLTYEPIGDNFHSRSGTFNLTTCDTINGKIEANFNFTGTTFNTPSSSKTITDGVIVITKIEKQ